MEISAVGGYQTGTSTRSLLGQLSVDPAPVYGALLDIRVRPDATIQFLYERQDTVLDFDDNDPFAPTRVQFDLAIEYYQFGGTVEFGDSAFRPNFALTVGATRFHPAPAEIKDAWRFSIGVGGGFKQYLNDRIGFASMAACGQSSSTPTEAFFARYPAVASSRSKQTFSSRRTSPRGSF